jgi:hypothetical protein
MAPWTFDMKLPLSTQFTFRSLTFAVGEGRDLKMLPPGPTARASHSCSLIYIKQYLLRFGSICSVIHSLRQAHSGYSDRDVHPLDINWSTEFTFIGIVPQPRFI